MNNNNHLDGFIYEEYYEKWKGWKGYLCELIQYDDFNDCNNNKKEKGYSYSRDPYVLINTNNTNVINKTCDSIIPLFFFFYNKQYLNSLFSFLQ